MPIDRIIDVIVPVMWTQLAHKGQQEQLKTVVLSKKTFGVFVFVVPSFTCGNTDVWLTLSHGSR